MTLVPLPAKGIRNIEWTAPTPVAFVVKSGWSGFQTVGDPGGISDGFRAKVEIAPGRDERLPWHAFYGRLRGPVNRFRLPVNPQLACPVATLTVNGSGQTGNRFLHSADFAQSAWTKTNVSAALLDVEDPDGERRATTLIENGVNGVHGIAQSYTGVFGNRTAFSIFARWIGSRRYVQLAADSGGAIAIFDLVAGVIVSTVGAPEARIEAAGDGWYRLSLIFNVTTPGALAAQFLMGDAPGSFSYLGAGGTVAVWGAQVQFGPTSLYLPTAGAGSLTRAAFIVGTPTPSTTYLRAGQSITLRNRLFTLTTDLVSDAAGIAAVNVAPDLGTLTIAGDVVQCQRPYAVMRSTTPALGWSEMLANIDQPFAFDAEEVLT